MKKIVLVEDDPFLIDIYSKKLSKSGFKVFIADNGQKGIDISIKEKPDLVILDIVLPEVEGWEVLKEIKKADKNIKVMIMSNLGQKEEVDKGIKLGATKYLIKAHYTPSQIIEEIEKLL